MRVGVVSDIHSNLPALEAVLSDMGEVDELWCLGDFVGYGPWPNECVSMLRERGVRAIAGNHDLAVVGAISTAAFNTDAAFATAWTAEQLTPELTSYLAELPPMTRLDRKTTLAHGSPRQPVWEYLLDDETASASFKCFKTQLCFIGHTHIPSIFVKEGRRVAVSHMPESAQFTVGKLRAIANPGSVGQPRDRDPRSSYLIFDSGQGTLEWRRVAYDIGRTQARMREVELPEFFVERLSIGV